MPQKITERDVCRRIVEQRAEGLAMALRHSIGRVRYTKAMFREDMMAGGFISSQPTLTAKRWILVADGVIVSMSGTDYLEIRQLLLKASMSASMVVQRAEAYEEAEAAEEARP